MRSQCRSKWNQRISRTKVTPFARHPYTPSSRRTARQSGKRGEQQVQLTAAESGDEDLDQSGARPALAGQTFIERSKTRGKDFRPRGTAAAPDGRVLEQPSQFGIDNHGLL